MTFLLISGILYCITFMICEYLFTGLMHISYFNSERINEMLAFLLVLCRINDGQNPNLRYETVDGGGDGEGLTPLEDLLLHWSTLVNMQVEDELVTEGQSLANVIKFEVKDKIIISEFQCVSFSENMTEKRFFFSVEAHFQCSKLAAAR